MPNNKIIGGRSVGGPKAPEPPAVEGFTVSESFGAPVASAIDAGLDLTAVDANTFVVSPTLP